MKTTCCAVLFLMTGTMFLSTAASAADVCSEGIGIPPFLSSGAKPNLLMVLDNSGSMLDAAYSKDGAFCFDDSYDNGKVYAGYFQNDKWYRWQEGAYLPWQNGKSYTIGDRVYVNGVLWKSLGTETATGTSIETDSKVAWEKVFSIPKWQNGKAYLKDDIIWSGPVLYKATANGTSNDPSAANGLNLADDTGVVWDEVESTWIKGKNYPTGSIVAYKGVLYETDAGGTSNGTGVHDDKGVTWKKLNEGSFVEISKTDALSLCSSAAGADKHSHADLCISLNKTVTPAQVSAFAARGNMLNWAMSSKFDVEKKILTGGKYNYKEKMLVNEHRGCSGSKLIKQISLTDGNFLSLAVRGSRHNDKPSYEDRLDSTDDTGRLEVLAITDTSFKISPECEAAINRIISNGLNGSQNFVASCLESFPDASSMAEDTRPTLNNSLQACWQDDPATAAFEINNGLWSNLINDCVALYTDTKQPSSNIDPSRKYHPSELRPADGGPFLCYGVYDSELDHMNRVGYMGRCWISGGGGLTMSYCNRLTAQSYGSASMGTGCWTVSNKGVISADSKCQNYRNFSEGGVLYVQQCVPKPSGSSKCPDPNWKNKGRWSEDQTICDYPSNPISIGGNVNGVWEQDPANTQGNCVLEAMKDYCDAMSVPEVIDPSGSTGKTGETAGMPGMLRDSYLIAFLGGKDPISTMKGNITQNTRPKGVVHNVSKDLRLGVMAFRYVGAKYECDNQTASSKIEKYCPLNNKDGAQLLVPLQEGDLFIENDTNYDGGKRRHVDDLAEAINGIRGTSWTPLAEAVYSALGYYTQNPKFCLNQENGQCADFSTAKDPVQYWCQDNHILLITEGESTADISKAVQDFTATPSTYFVNKKDEDIVTGTGDPNPQFCTEASGETSDSTKIDSLFRSRYLDDMTWWGQHPLPLYQKRYVKDADGNEKDKKNIYTHVVTTGVLVNEGTGECNPETLMTQAAVGGGTTGYYPGENPQKLEDNLYAVLADILTRSSAGSAASVISSSRSGSGAAYQAVFWPKHEDKDPDGNSMSNKVTWVGDVHALFVSAEGKMYEDSNQDGKLDLSSDKWVRFYYSTNGKKTRGCYEALVPVTASDGSVTFQCSVDPAAPADCDGSTCVEIQEIKYLWSANKSLREIDDNDIPSTRKIFTWNDANNDGIVDKDTEWFKLSELNKSKWEALNTRAASAVSPRGPVTKDFLTRDEWSNFVEYNPGKTDVELEMAALKALTDWLQGIDHFKDQFNLNVSDRSEPKDVDADGIFELPLRSRQFTYKTGTSGFEQKTWRLGDIIHSTPIVVSRPAESYHYLYRDPTYAKFASYYANRRHMIYFGGNDGMLHAVNGGFYFENGNQFCLTKDCTVDTNAPALGQEMWAYIPYNLQPHLKCLADRFYAHKYFVDQKPRIFDAQIFDKNDPDHPGGWGTILVGSMRFGGAPVQAKDLNGMDGVGDPTKKDQREFVSAYFILDITNPDEDPELLGELTRTTEDDGSKYVKLNYTTSSPSMIIMRDGSSGHAESAWYLVMGNGPTEQDGTNTADEHGKVAILPLSRLAGKVSSWSGGESNGVSDVKQSFRIPNSEPGTGNADFVNTGVFDVPVPIGAASKETSGSFLSDIISVDYNVDLVSDDALGARYRTDAVYFGTVDGLDFAQYPSGYRPDLPDDQFYWKGGGRLFRLVTKKGVVDTTTHEFVEEATEPSKWGDGWTDDAYSKGPLRLLADVKMPVIASPSIGYDQENYWIYTGTGRFFGEKDKTDDGWCLDGSTDCGTRSRNAFFGIKEPVKDANTSFSGRTPDGGASATCQNPVMTWGTIQWDSLCDKNDNSCLKPGNTDVPTMQSPPAGERGLIRTDQILVEASLDKQIEGNIWCYDVLQKCSNESGMNPCEVSSSMCFPSPDNSNRLAKIKEDRTDKDGKPFQVYTFEQLRKYIAGKCEANTEGKYVTTGVDGWYHVFQDARERNIGTSALLGGLLTFTTYQPYNDKCTAEGGSYLYGLHYQTGTAWTKSVFGTYDVSSGGIRILKKDGKYVSEKMSLGTGLSTAPSLHVGSGGDAPDAKAFIQTSTGEIIEVEQENLPLKSDTRSGRINWTDRCYPLAE